MKIVLMRSVPELGHTPVDFSGFGLCVAYVEEIFMDFSYNAEL